MGLSTFFEEKKTPKKKKQGNLKMFIKLHVKNALKKEVVMDLISKSRSQCLKVFESLLCLDTECFLLIIYNFVIIMSFNVKYSLQLLFRKILDFKVQNYLMRLSLSWLWLRYLYFNEFKFKLLYFINIFITSHVSRQWVKKIFWKTVV